jgi:hypothetical protein
MKLARLLAQAPGLSCIGAAMPVPDLNGEETFVRVRPFIRGAAVRCAEAAIHHVLSTLLFAAPQDVPRNTCGIDATPG